MATKEVVLLDALLHAHNSIVDSTAWFYMNDPESVGREMAKVRVQFYKELAAKAEAELRQLLAEV